MSTEIIIGSSFFGPSLADRLGVEDTSYLDVNLDGYPAEWKDVQYTCIIAHGIGLPSSFRERQIQRQGVCTEEGRTFCRNGVLFECLPDLAVGDTRNLQTLIPVRRQEPSIHERCITNPDGDDYYRMGKPIQSLYDS